MELTSRQQRIITLIRTHQELSISQIMELSQENVRFNKCERKRI